MCALFGRFRTGKGMGYSSHFVGNTLVLETVERGHKKPQTHSVNFVFQSYQVRFTFTIFSVVHVLEYIVQYQL